MLADDDWLKGTFFLLLLKLFLRLVTPFGVGRAVSLLRKLFSRNMIFQVGVLPEHQREIQTAVT